MNKKRMSVLILAASTSFLSSAVLADTLTGTSGVDLLTGATGNSTLSGGAGDDLLYGDSQAGSGEPVNMEKLTWRKNEQGNDEEASAQFETFGYSPAFSPDGTKLLVSTAQQDLIPGLSVPSNVSQIYLKNLETGAYQLISVAAQNPSQAGNANSDAASFSPDGKKVIFRTRAENIHGGAGNSNLQIVVRDLETNAVTVISRSRVNDAWGSGDSHFPSFSADGTLVIFYTAANNLVSGDMANDDVFIARYTGAADDYKSLTLASTDGNGNFANENSYGSFFSPDSQSIAFVSGAQNLAGSFNDGNNGQDIFIKSFDAASIVKNGPQFLNGTVDVVSVDKNGNQGLSGAASCDSGGTAPLFRSDGKAILFESSCAGLVVNDTNGSNDIYIKATALDGSWWSGELIRVTSTASGGAGNGASYSPAFSPDGTKVAFESIATDLVSGTTGNDNHIIVKDLKAGSFTLLSKPIGGIEADGSSSYPFFTPHGRAIAFSSGAKNLVTPNDMGMTSDVFLATLPTPAAGNDTLDGGAGLDRMLGGRGNDTYIVDNSGDKVVEYTGEGTDTVTASITYALPENVENLALTGKKKINGTGNDLANRLTAGAGQNKLTGGKGADRFIFLKTSHSKPGKKARDTILDFNASEKDVIDLSKIDANTRIPKNQKFRFIGNRPFSGAGGEVRFAKGVLSADTDGDKRADFAVKVVVKQGKLTKARLKL